MNRMITVFLCLFLLLWSAGNGFAQTFSIEWGKPHVFKKQIKEADPKTFEILNDVYAKDKNRVFVAQYQPGYYSILNNVDLETFQVINFEGYASPYAKDRSAVYFGERVLEGADPETFEYFARRFARDKNAVYVNSGHHGKMLEIITDGDPKSFEILSSNYAKNDRNAYFIGEMLQEIGGADSASFVALEDGQYAKDRLRVYYDRRVLMDADPESFRVLDGLYAEDDKRVFYKGETVDGAMPGKYISYKRGRYVIDKGQVSYGSVPLEGVDLATFETFMEECPEEYNSAMRQRFARDRNHIYRSGEIFKEADPETFETLDCHYSKDKNHVYSDQKILEGADPASFEVLRPYFGKDKDRLYYYWAGIPDQMMQQVDVPSLHFVSGPYAQDRNHSYRLDRSGLKIIKEIPEAGQASLPFKK